MMPLTAWLIVLVPYLLLSASPMYTVHAAVNLAEPWSTGPLYNANQAHCTLEAAVTGTGTIGYAVLKDGVLLAEGYGDGYNSANKYFLYSATKSWVSMLLGKLVDLELLDTHDTLGDIFPNASDWVGVSEATEKMTVTLHEALSFTGGLRENKGVITGYSTLRETLNYLGYDATQRGTWDYLDTSHLMSWIIYRTTGLTPLEFARAHGIFEKLGIGEDEFQWDNQGTPVEGSAFGLWMNVRQMAKLGQLFLQEGLVAPGGEQLISSSWIQTSTSNQLTQTDRTYGYQWYPRSDGSFLAIGAIGQYIFVYPSRNVVVASLRSTKKVCGQERQSEFLNIAISEETLDGLDISESCNTLRDWLGFWGQRGASLVQSLVPQSLVGGNDEIGALHDDSKLAEIMMMHGDP